LTDWTIEQPGPPGLLLGFTNVDSGATAEKLARRILDVA
jgi:hypothetical protein